jgi:hypothetical protein
MRAWSSSVMAAPLLSDRSLTDILYSDAGQNPFQNRRTASKRGTASQFGSPAPIAADIISRL